MTRDEALAAMEAATPIACSDPEITGTIVHVAERSALIEWSDGPRLGARIDDLTTVESRPA
jgi:hypothetical protein